MNGVHVTYGYGRLLVTIIGKDEGVTIELPKSMSVSAITEHIEQVRELLGKED